MHDRSDADGRGLRELLQAVAASSPASPSEQLDYKEGNWRFAARKLLAETDRNVDVGAFLALEFGKPVPDDARQEIADFIRRYVKAVPVADLRRHGIA